MRKVFLVLYISIMAIFFPSCDPCGTNPPGCVNGSCVADLGQATCECDIGYEGEICEVEIEAEPCVAPTCVPYTPIDAEQLAPEGCDRYIGAHPTNPGENFCCSAPSLGEAPVCAPGDTPDIPCVVELEFCEDGTAKKAWSPQPESGYPGHTISTEGTWTVDAATGDLVIFYTSTAMDGAMITVTTETFPSAFTYDNGTKLDLYSVKAVVNNEGGIGLYHREAANFTSISGMWDATLDSNLSTDMIVTATDYESTFTQEVECNPRGSMVCPVTPKSDVVNTGGTHTLPLDIYITPTNGKMFQTDEAKALVFERQLDPCDEIECGAHGYCEDGACVCTDAYIGDFCDTPTPCTGVGCGENGSCVVVENQGICECDPGYEGESCETDINECVPNPCLHGGTCEEGVPGTYECTCIDGYTGDNCEQCPSDADGDGYGDPASSLCIHLELDCDDTRATVYPGAPELCDGIDNQCPGDAGYGGMDEDYTHCGDMVSIPSGCFNMGDAFEEGWPDELPLHNVCLSDFEMDIYEITNAAYAECVAAGGCTAPSSNTSYSRPSYYGDPLYNDYPVIWMWWNDISSYCNWAGKRLPSEAEWEYAARGGLEGKRYPWGNWITRWHANYNFNVGDTSEVGSYAANGYGLYDMAGNVWEWVADWFSEDYYSVSPPDDPKGPASGKAPVRRGGSWDHGNFGLRTAVRCDFCHADRHGNNLGGRCAR